MITIYKLTSPTGRSYIGQTNNLKTRWAAHCSPKSGCIVVRDAIQKHGFHNFDVVVLARVAPLEANAAEMAAIKKYGTLAPNGYNIHYGGDCERMAMDDYPGHKKQATLPGYIYEVQGRRERGYEVKRPGMERKSYTAADKTMEEKLEAAKQYLKTGNVEWRKRTLPPYVYDAPGKQVMGYAVQKQGYKRRSFTSSRMTIEERLVAATEFAASLQGDTNKLE